MKYESTILKRLIDTYGVVGNPRYISEIIKEFIVRGKERFPELFTYQADWLAHIDEFGLNPTYTVSYTGQSIYAPNTLERPVKRAILTGQTLVNISSLSGEITIEPSSIQHIESSLIQQNKTFTFMFNCTSVPSTGFIELRQMLDNTALKIENIKVVQGYNKFKVTTINKELNRFRFKNDSTSETDFVFNNLLIIEGDYTNIDIPFFTGMQSVKLPVLKATGKNLFDGELTSGTINGSNGVISNSATRFYTSEPILLKANLPYTFTISSTQENADIKFRQLMLYKDKKLTSFAKTYGDKFNQLTYTSTEDVYAALTVFDAMLDQKVDIDKVFIQIEQGSTTPYESYKSNILTVNEEVELRGIGDVCDTVDLMTGDYTKRIGEYTITGKEPNLVLNTTGTYPMVELIIKDAKSNGRIMGNKIQESVSPIYSSNAVLGVDLVGTAIRIRTQELINGQSLDEFKETMLPLTIKYELAQESVKTVDLTILDQNGQNVKQLMSFKGGTHFNTRSSEGSLLPTVSVSVETDLEETLKMCSLDGNTM